MKVAYYLLLIALGLLVELSIYLVFRIRLHSSWMPIVLTNYVLIGLTIAILGPLSLSRKLRKKANARERFYEFYYKSVINPTGLDRVRLVAIVIATTIENCFVWPIELLRGICKGFYIGVKAGFKGEKHPKLEIVPFVREDIEAVHDHQRAAFSLIMIGLLYELSFFRIQSDRWIMWFIVLFGMGVVARHLTYVVNSGGATLHIRRKARNPYLIFWFIVISDLFTILFVASVVLSGKYPAQLDWQDIEVGIATLFKFKEFIKMVSGEPISTTQAVVGTVGILYYSTFYRSIVRLKDLERDDSDYLWIAGKRNFDMDFTGALRYLKRVKNESQDALIQRMVAQIGLGQLAGARSTAQRAIAIIGYQSTLERTYSLMFGAVALNPEFPHQVMESVINDAIQKGVQDVLVQDFTKQYFRFYPDNIEVLPRTLQDKADLFPLSTAFVSFVNRDGLNATSILESVVCGSEVEEVVRLVMILRVNLYTGTKKHDELESILYDWVMSEIPKIRSFVSSLELEPWQFGIIVGELTWVCEIAKFSERTSCESLDEVLGQIMQHIQGDNRCETSAMFSRNSVEEDFRNRLR